MSAYPWYTRATDIAHRLTVVGLVGFTVYMTAGITYTLYENGKIAEERLAKQKEIMQKQAEFEQEQQQ
jgi:cytochrome c oxidase assembly factor 14